MLLSGPELLWNGRNEMQSEDKSFQWFGATVESGSHGVILVSQSRDACHVIVM
jgi:hypothetical protein